VAARGIDVEDVTHVINYQCPEEDKTYIHRIGRTGRAGKTGIAVSFIDWDDVPRWKLINESLGLDFADPAETYSTSKHLFDDLDIPEGVTGRLPSAQRVRAGLGAETVEDLGETGGKRRKAASNSGSRQSGDRHSEGAYSGGRGNGKSSGGRTRSRGGRTETSPTEAAVRAVEGVETVVTGPTSSDADPAANGEAIQRRRRSRRRTRGGSAASAAVDAPADLTAGS
jgi:superfamily II DNA/RNA helicase